MSSTSRWFLKKRMPDGSTARIQGFTNPNEAQTVADRRNEQLQAEVYFIEEDKRRSRAEKPKFNLEDFLNGYGGSDDSTPKPRDGERARRRPRRAPRDD